MTNEIRGNIQLGKIELRNQECELCLGLHTKLGDICSCVSGIFTSHEIQQYNLTDDQKLRLVLSLFEQVCLDERTKMIQGFKKTNIKAINDR